jgi:aryl-alcohol dehydrogenase-like predicted oxidoreductase
VETSLKNLGVSKVGAIMLHSAPDVAMYGQSLADAMGKLLELGYAEQVGVSVYDNEQIEEMLKYDVYTVTQVPMSIFDQRLIANGAVKKLQEKGVTVFVRSVFLQGLFFLDPDGITDPILLEHAAPKIRTLRQIAKAEGMTVAQLAIAFMRDTVGVTSLVLGADTPEQVKENIAYFDAPSLSESVMATLREEFAQVDIPEIMKVLSRPKK